MDRYIHHRCLRKQALYTIEKIMKNLGLPRWLSGKESACNAGAAGDLGLIPGKGNGNPLQYSCLGNPTDRGAWRATVHVVAKQT